MYSTFHFLKLTDACQVGIKHWCATVIHIWGSSIYRQFDFFLILNSTNTRTSINCNKICELATQQLVEREESTQVNFLHLIYIHFPDPTQLLTNLVN